MSFRKASEIYCLSFLTIKHASNGQSRSICPSALFNVIYHPSYRKISNRTSLQPNACNLTLISVYRVTSPGNLHCSEEVASHGSMLGWLKIMINLGSVIYGMMGPVNNLCIICSTFGQRNLCPPDHFFGTVYYRLRAHVKSGQGCRSSPKSNII